MRNIISKKSAKITATKSKVSSKSVAIKKKGTTNTEPVNSAGLLNELYVEKAVQALYAGQKEKNNKGELFLGDEESVFMQVFIAKIPCGLDFDKNLPVKHSILPADSDILLVTPDLPGKDVNDFEENIEYYRSLLNKHGITTIKDIMPYTQIRREYKDFEMKYKLARLYDLVICGNSILGYVLKNFGTILKKKNKSIEHMNFKGSNLGAQLNKILNQTNILIHSNGDCYSLKVGHTGMTENQLVENIMEVGFGLGKIIPGGFPNIKGLLIKTGTGKPMQLYLSTVHAKKIPPINSAKQVQSGKSRKQKTGTVVGELSTRDDVIVHVKPSGEVITQKDGVIDNNVSKKVKVAGKKVNGKSIKKTTPLKKKTLKKTISKQKLSKLSVKKLA